MRNSATVAVRPINGVRGFLADPLHKTFADCVLHVGAPARARLSHAVGRNGHRGWHECIDQLRKIAT